MATQQVHHLIAGERRGAASRERRNPADASDVVSAAAEGTPEDALAAIDAARAAQPAWAAMPTPARGEILDRASRILASRVDEVARDLTREEGKTIDEARGEVRRAADVLRFYGGEGWRQYGDTMPSTRVETTVYTRREPVGVVAIITPWNFPIAIPAWKSAPALVSGNAVVLKPAELTPLTAQHLALALMEAGLPNGVLNVVHGEGPAVGPTLTDDPRVAAVSFTGSMAVGGLIHRAVSKRMGRVQLEMGGKNATIVTEGADLSRAAENIAASAFGVTGQACTATSRVIVPPAIADNLVHLLVEQAQRFQPGNGLDERVRMGPVVSEDQVRRDLEYLEIAIEEGGELACGRPRADGQLLGPAIVRGVQRDHTIAQHEVFGPVLAVLEADDLDEAIDIANDVPFGLAAALCTNDLAATHRFIDRIQAGVVKINQPTIGVELNVPFGGIKGSSTGTFREQGPDATDFYSWEKAVYVGLDR
ncbi:MAG: aldehyde dehydrogenase family protein [Dehalococcoidia bacterium]